MSGPLATPVPSAAEAAIPLHPTACALCGTLGHARELYPATFREGDLTPRVFSARRLPDQIHYRMVVCRACGLVRSDPVIDPELLHSLYARSTFDYGSEVEPLQTTYGGYLDRVRRHVPEITSLLEVGCGNGFFLEEALRRGVTQVRGVEPSAAAIEQAPAGIRDRIVCDVMRPGLFREGEFDVVCLFQVFDHLADPVSLLAECRRVLRPGGILLLYNHNVAALSARILGKRSPIIDIEHTYLYSPRTIQELASRCGFGNRECGRGWNHCSLAHLSRLLPWPRPIKRWAAAFLDGTGLGRLVLPLPLGNLYLITQRPSS